jgi:2-polyprenyl-3-methyl-5-hydroxy-6-metoxy-1,4-benzoquinol methylase
MRDTPSIAVFHEVGWKGHEVGGCLWQDPTNPEKQRLSIAALKELGDPRSVKLLDFGCGNGVLSQFFRASGYTVTAIDVSPAIVKAKQECYPEIDFRLVQPDEPVPYSDGYFDAVFCSEVIEHIYGVHFIFGELYRLLRPGGLLILTTPYHGRIKNVIVSLFFFERHFDPTWQHIRFWTKKSLTNVCLAHGLQPITWSHVGRFWPVPKSFFVVCKKR